MKRSMKSEGNRVLERFPDAHFDIALLMRENPGFLSLCQEYSACVDALQYWSDSKEPEAAVRVAEYRSFVRELEEEILGALKEAKASTPLTSRRDRARPGRRRARSILAK